VRSKRRGTFLSTFLVSASSYQTAVLVANSRVQRILYVQSATSTTLQLTREAFARSKSIATTEALEHALKAMSAQKRLMVTGLLVKKLASANAALAVDQVRKHVPQGTDAGQETISPGLLSIHLRAYAGPSKHRARPQLRHRQRTPLLRPALQLQHWLNQHTPTHPHQQSTLSSPLQSPHP
jgi:hypothetical protein